MGVKNEVNPPELTYESLLKFVREYEEPCITAGEVGDHFGITNEAANYRLKQLEERGKIRGKQVGASAKVWYAIG